MKYNILLLPTAWEDLKKIEDYYMIQFSAETALKVTDNILNTIQRLELFPNFGSMTPEEWLNSQKFKMILCNKHVAIYRVFERDIYIYHIADTKTDYTKLFYNA